MLFAVGNNLELNVGYGRGENCLPLGKQIP